MKTNVKGLERVARIAAGAVILGQAIGVTLFLKWVF